jgi:FkbM family methyltransferase
MSDRPGRGLPRERQYHGQKGQDRWIIEEVFPGKQGGFFVDLAATDGVKLSNTYVLEKRFGWTGIAIEPNPDSFALLKQNRSCICVNACIDGDFGTVEFLPNAGHGGIVADDTDNSPAVRAARIDEWRTAGKTLTLNAYPLAEILRRHEAPAAIEFLSLDVEGSETRILRTFPFEQYRFLAMCIERPTPELNTLLFRNGYLFVRNVTFDTFYVHESIPNLASIAREPFEQILPKEW